MGARSRNKGAAFEREVAQMIYDHLGLRMQRNLEQYRTRGLGDLIGWDFVLIECKRHATATRAQVDAWWDETVREASTVQLKPVLFYRADRQPVRVVVSAADVVDGVLAPWPLEMSFDAFCEVAREKLL